VNEEALTHWGPVAPKTKKNINKYIWKSKTTRNIKE
jgi:hypothetical protein